MFLYITTLKAYIFFFIISTYMLYNVLNTRQNIQHNKLILQTGRYVQHCTLFGHSSYCNVYIKLCNIKLFVH